MFEFEVQTLRHWRLRVGRWSFRTWRPLFMTLPRGYRSPQTVYEVISWNDETDSIDYMLAAFDSEGEARKLIADLAAEGRHANLNLNFVTVYARVTDWHFDR